MPQLKQQSAVFAALFVLDQDVGSTPWTSAEGMRLNVPARRCVHLAQGKKPVSVDLGDTSVQVGDATLALDAVQRLGGGKFNARIGEHNLTARVLRADTTLYVMCEGHTERFLDLTDDVSRFGKLALNQGGVVAPMPGQVIAVNVKAGDKVKQGDVLAVVEAMKMEHSVTSPKDGEVTSVACKAGDRVEEGAVLVEL